jgi:hypothetical protein
MYSQIVQQKDSKIVNKVLTWSELKKIPVREDWGFFVLVYFKTNFGVFLVLVCLSKFNTI